MTLFASATGAEWLAAIGTVSAVVVAVGLQIALWTRERHQAPVLSLQHDRDDSQVELDYEYEELPTLRLRVANRRGKHAAEGVEVLVREVLEGDVTTRLGNSPLIWTNTAGGSIGTVAAGIHRFVDLGYITGEAEGHADLSLALVTPPRDSRHVLKAGAYTVGVGLVARNCNASFWDVHVAFSGDIDWTSEDDLGRKVDIFVAGGVP